MIELKNLTKKYDDFTAVNNLNLTIETGGFFGLLGPNGAGKSTTIGMLSTLFLPTEGEILIDGEKLTRKNTALKRRISVVTQEYSMRQDMTIEEIMEYQGRLYFVPKKERREKTRELLEFCGLMDYRRRTVRKLSGGMKRKLMVCRALLTKPDILLLDEPTAALDPIAESEMYERYDAMIREKTGIFISHRLSSTRFCDRILFLENGRIVEEGSHDVLMEKGGSYAKLFTLQARYYQKKREEEEIYA